MAQRSLGPSVYIGSLARSGSLAGTALAPVAGRHLIDLVGLATSSRAPERDEEGSIGRMRLRAALDMIRANFLQPDLTVEQVAVSQGISVRQLQKVLERGNVSFKACLNDLRLNAAREILTSPRGGRMTITEVAYAAGFGDISHFNRAFRKRYGDTPTGVRGAAPAAGLSGSDDAPPIG